MPTKRPDADPKIRMLKEHGTLNPHPEEVVDEFFLAHDFFDRRDLLQVKYEMLRRVSIEGRPRQEAAKAFGFSRPSFYSAQKSFEQQGLAGLMARRRGPRRGHKLTDEVMQYIRQAMAQDDSLRARALVPMLKQRLGLRIHPRSIERALARLKKKRS